MAHNAQVNYQGELNTITSTLDDLSARISVLVDHADDSLSGEVYTELVAAERTIGALLRRLNRVARKVD